MGESIWEKVQGWAINEVREVRRAPVALVIAAIVGGAIAWFGIDWFYAERFAVMEQRISQLQEVQRTAPPLVVGPVPQETGSEAASAKAPNQPAPPAAVGRGKATGHEREGKPAQVNPSTTAPPPASVVQGSGSIAQIGGSNNTATIVNPKLVRTFNDQQATTLVQSLKPFAGQKISVFMNQATTESGAFGQRLVALMKEAGVVVVAVDHGMQIGAEIPESGVSFLFNWDKQKEKQFVETFANVLVGLGVLKSQIIVNPPTVKGNPDHIILHIYALGR